MFIPISYNIKNIVVRWRTTLSTLLAIALVTAVFILVAALYQGIKEFYTATGAPENVLFLRKGATAEINSQINLESINIIKYLDGIEKDDSGTPIMSAETLTVIALERTTSDGNANVQVRGMGKFGPELRPQVTLIEGRMFRPGLRELVVSKTLLDRFKNIGIGKKILAIRGEWNIVGIFDGHKSAYDSEMWTDNEDLRGALRRNNRSMIIARLKKDTNMEEFSKIVESDKRLTITVTPEMKYYADLVTIFNPIKIIGVSLAIIMAVGACFAAMNTMYTMIHHRTKEIGTLRVLGFKRRHILFSFLLESVFISFLGGLIGILLAYPMNGYSTGTANFKTFSEVVFEFKITYDIAMSGLYFSVWIGFIGGLFPSVSAARKPILKALKSA